MSFKHSFLPALDSINIPVIDLISIFSSKFSTTDMTKSAQNKTEESVQVSAVFLFRVAAAAVGPSLCGVQLTQLGGSCCSCTEDWSVPVWNTAHTWGGGGLFLLPS